VHLPDGRRTPLPIEAVDFAQAYGRSLERLQQESMGAQVLKELSLTGPRLRW
jgi:hypothetical protein